MLIQAAGLALLAALSPTALLIAAIYLGSARPRLVTAFYLAGAVLMSLVMGVILLAVLRSVNLQRPAEHTPRYGLRLILGILLLAAAVVVARRQPRPPDPSKPPKGFVAKMVADPAPLSAFLVGLLVFAPGVSFLAAVQVIATASTGPLVTLTGLLIVITVGLLLVWLPLLGYLAAPTATTDRLRSCNDWLRDHGREATAWALLICGFALVVNGALGLAGTP